ncbi:hypothetical protein EJF36_19580 [Bacillus sp. HMF5848]|uniref:glycoside hydrolase family 66 protein n=1 Tax=Bacillus sp. HMF5848 TaxID=2495421 RepID=UPI000F77FEFF|nr:glycoside hydrolase family 66 protein [Bacillus sp. HMF5848]RSK28900.1 hypothetical protein EJF36_19580 [Bacillus sp. HMF5848]
MKKRKLLAPVLALSLAVTGLQGCSTDTNLAQSTTIEQGTYFMNVTTDLAAYKPGDTVNFQLSMKKQEKGTSLLVKYKHLHETIHEEEIKLDGTQNVEWSWTPGDEDFKGYLVDVYLQNGKDIVDHTAIAVDVSSDWSKFPRYGYLADFYELEREEQEAVIERLNRFHLNGLQFYDWQYKHEKPLKMENGKVADTWKDIANRIVSKETVETYIELAHEKNMMAMNYNLLFGAYEDHETEGVKREWGIYKDPLHQDIDMHPLPDSWASDIHLMNPANEEWQDFIFNAEKETFEHLAFDGWHVDQLGDRGTRWDYNGDRVDLAATYSPFLQRAKDELDVPLVMNAVEQFAQMYLATQAPVDFLYTEVWSSFPHYKNLKGIIDQNGKFSKGKLQTVLAAYMNYDYSNSVGEFNTPGVLLTNAVIFAAGGAHLELGENMLSKEYFPHKNLTITPELEQSLQNYYDFLVAYQNLLRDGAEEIEKDISIEGDIEVSQDAELGKVWSFVKQKDNKEIIHLINFTDATTMEWKDNEGSQAEPTERKDVTISIPTDKEVASVWMASPDVYNATSVTLPFKEKDGVVTITLPSLKYWDMVVLQYK